VNRRNVILAASTFAAICGGGVVAGMKLAPPPPNKVDVDTQCPFDEPPRGYVAIVIDLTDSWTEPQLEKVRALIKRVAGGVRAGERFELVELPAVLPTVLVPVLSRCSPGDGSDADPIRTGRIFIRDRFNRDFMSPVAAYASRLIMDHAAPTSPIAEVLIGISQRDEFTACVGRRELHVVSDLLENYNGFTQYRTELPAFEKFAKTAKGKELTAKLAGARVHVAYLSNQGALQYQGQRHLQWWRDWLKANGGVLAGVEAM